MRRRRLDHSGPPSRAASIPEADRCGNMSFVPRTRRKSRSGSWAGVGRLYREDNRKPMNVRYASALSLLIGWYLMYPRTPNQPISQWKILKTFDSAAGCHAALENQWAIAREHRKALQTPEPSLHPEVKASMQAATESEANSKCIASDDPRLKKK